MADVDCVEVFPAGDCKGRHAVLDERHYHINVSIFTATDAADAMLAWPTSLGIPNRITTHLETSSIRLKIERPVSAPGVGGTVFEGDVDDD